jgi:hypothetical protein
MKIIGICIIIIMFVIGTSHIAYCPTSPGSFDSGGYKGGSYSGSEDYKGSVGGKVKTEATTYSTTLGQELIDLEAAYKKGIINEEEYKELKRIIIEQRKK